LSFPMDVGSEDSIKKVKSELDNLGVTVKYLINNAGIYFIHPVSEMTGEMLDKIMKVNTYVKNSKYQVPLRKFIDKAINNVGKTVEPGEVAAIVKKALAASNPKRVYNINRNKTITFMSLLPQRTVDYLIRKIFR